MNDLAIDKSDMTPMVHFDHKSGDLLIKGKSLPDNAIGFYEPLLSWIESYLQNPAEKTSLIFHFSYFNTPTNRFIIKLINAIKTTPSEYQVIWRFIEDDEEIMEFGEKLEGIVDIKLKFEPV